MMTDEQLAHDDEVARLDGNYLARKYIAELRSLRLSDEERAALRFAAKVVSASEHLFADRMADPRIKAHVEQCRAASAVLARLTGGES